MLFQGSHTVSLITITPNSRVINNESGTYNDALWHMHPTDEGTTTKVIYSSPAEIPTGFNVNVLCCFYDSVCIWVNLHAIISPVEHSWYDKVFALIWSPTSQVFFTFGSWGASGARSGTQCLKGVCGVGRRADVEYTLCAVLMVPIMSDKLNCHAGTKGTDAPSGPDGAATSGVLEYWMMSVESSNCMTERAVSMHVGQRVWSATLLVEIIIIVVQHQGFEIYIPGLKHDAYPCLYQHSKMWPQPNPTQPAPSATNVLMEYLMRLVLVHILQQPQPVHVKVWGQ